MKKQKIAGWVVSGLVSAFLIFASASGKFTEWEGKQELFDRLGYSPELLVKIGILEVFLAVLILVPKMDFIAMLLLTAYLGGATSTHVRVGDPFYFPIVVAIVAWIGLILRKPDLKKIIWS